MLLEGTLDGRECFGVEQSPQDATASLNTPLWRREASSQSAATSEARGPICIVSCLGHGVVVAPSPVQSTRQIGINNERIGMDVTIAHSSFRRNRTLRRRSRSCHNSAKHLCLVR